MFVYLKNVDSWRNKWRHSIACLTSNYTGKKVKYILSLPACTTRKWWVYYPSRSGPSASCWGRTRRPWRVTCWPAGVHPCPGAGTCSSGGSSGAFLPTSPWSHPPSYDWKIDKNEHVLYCKREEEDERGIKRRQKEEEKQQETNMPLLQLCFHYFIRPREVQQTADPRQDYPDPMVRAAGNDEI